jgi:hypothetical protein
MVTRSGEQTACSLVCSVPSPADRGHFDVVLSEQAGMSKARGPLLQQRALSSPHPGTATTVDRDRHRSRPRWCHLQHHPKHRYRQLSGWADGQLIHKIRPDIYSAAPIRRRFGGALANGSDHLHRRQHPATAPGRSASAPGLESRIYGLKASLRASVIIR